MSNGDDDDSKRDSASPEQGFAPMDLSDGRKIGDWKSKYEPEALAIIRSETRYLVALLLIGFVGLALTWLGLPQKLLDLSTARARVFREMGCAGFGGLLGGTIFGMK